MSKIKQLNIISYQVLEQYDPTKPPQELITAKLTLLTESIITP